MTTLRAIAPGQRLCADCSEVVHFAAYLDGSWRCPQATCGFGAVLAATPPQTPVYLRDRIIGYRTPQGRYLHAGTFWALSHTDRLRAYLLLVAPQARQSHALAAVCRIPAQQLTNFLKPDLAAGRIVRDKRGWRQTYYRSLTNGDAHAW